MALFWQKSLKSNHDFFEREPHRPNPAAIKNACLIRQFMRHISSKVRFFFHRMSFIWSVSCASHVCSCAVYFYGAERSKHSSNFPSPLRLPCFDISNACIKFHFFPHEQEEAKTNKHNWLINCTQNDTTSRHVHVAWVVRTPPLPYHAFTHVNLGLETTKLVSERARVWACR